MSKPVKAMLRRELVRRLEGLDSLVVVSLAGVDGVTNNRLRGELRAKGIRITVVKNSLAKQALAEVGLVQAAELIEGPSALVTGGPSAVEVVRELLRAGKEIPNLRIRGALMEGEVFGADRVVELSKFPTREEALATVAALVLAGGGAVVAAALGPGGRIAGALKAMEDRGAEEKAA